ncbi:MAG TPA: hypothetical protein VK656_05355 [Candidatus Acidoferrum sp.]|nr:hypothetical protein [Candidatus Acidoferrum sp.]
MDPREFAAGPNQTIVVYENADTGEEVDPLTMYGQIAADAAHRAEAGARIVSMAAVPTRHSQGFLSRQGSGYETKIAVAVVYATA